MYRRTGMTIGDDASTRIATYYAATRATDIEAWVCAFTANAMVHNPAGAASITGHQGLRELWMSLVGAFDWMGLSEDHVFVSGSGAAVKWTGAGVGCNGHRIRFDGIDVFEIDHRGKISGLWSYCDPAALRTQLRAGHLVGTGQREQQRAVARNGSACTAEVRSDVAAVAVVPSDEGHGQPSSPPA